MILNYEIIEEVYSTIMAELKINSIYYLAAFVAVILIIKRIAEEWKTQIKQDKTIDARMFLEMFWTYVVAICVIVGLPVFLQTVENLLAYFASEVHDQVGENLSKSYEESWESIKERYQEQLNTNGNFLDKALVWIYNQIDAMLYFLLFYIQKYLVFIFFAGRYLYLIILQIIAPFAIVLALNKDTIQYFYTYLKHVLVCYLMMPAYMIADRFADEIYLHMFKTYTEAVEVFALDVMTLFLLLTFLLKLYLFSFAQKQLTQIL